MPDGHINAESLKRLEADHQGILGLCLRLEQAVEDLKSGFPGQDIAALAASIRPLLTETHGVEEDALFPDFNRHAGSCFGAMMIEQLKAEHRCDLLAGEELAQTLTALAEGRCRLPLETVASMTSGFLESLRRHVHAEKLMLETLLAAKAEGREIFA